MNAPIPIVTLLTDFGSNDEYVGAMKGVMLGICPNVHLVDLSHQVPPQDIRQAVRILSNVAPYYPPHAVHLVVVDPGVGSARQPIAARTAQGVFVAPDNGVLTGVLRRAGGYSAVRLENPAYRLSEPSNTFHGRDIFAPAAAYLAAGVSLEQLGPALAALREIASPPLVINGNAVRGEVVAIDHFGNVMTSIRVLRWLDSDTLTFEADDEHTSVRFSAAAARVMIGWHTLTGIRQTYSLVGPDETLVLVSSSGELELAVNQGNASERLSLSLGDPVTLMLADAPR